MENLKLQQFTNCKILRNHELVAENLWVRNGKIVDPEMVIFNEKVNSTDIIDCKNAIIAPGFIELQINGAFGYDFSNCEDVEKSISYVAHRLLAHGVTSFCPTLVTSSTEVYHSVIPKIVKKEYKSSGATVLGIHLEGPFINVEKKGAHPASFIKNFENGFETVKEIYGGNLDNVRIVTLAPELKNSGAVIKQLSEMNITVSLGHSMANLQEGEIAIYNGATFITHLFNAMLPFHHRDPGLIGLLTSNNIPRNKTIYFGIIADGVHVHPSVLRMAYLTHPKGLVLVTDATSPMGLEEGSHNLGELSVEIRNKKAFVMGTNILCGSIATMIECVKLFLEATECSLEYALEAASLHPALVIGISHRKGTLNFGADADFIFLNNDLSIRSTWIAGECVYSVDE